MKKKNNFLGIILAIVLIVIAGIIGYNKGKIDGYISGSIKACPGEICTDETGCKTPAEYLVRSSCPFDSICLDSKCKAVCRWETEETKCNIDTECNCSSFYVGNDLKTCSCVKGFCTAIVS